MPSRPVVVAFDVLGTLVDLRALAPSLPAIGLAESDLPLVMARLLRNGFGLEASGRFLPFRAVAAATLQAELLGRGIDPDRRGIAELIEAFGDLPAYPDVAPALDALRGASVRALALTNGSAESTHRFLARQRLTKLLDRVISIDEVGHWKPHPAVYLHAARAMRVAPGELGLVAAHVWDLDGARAAGLVTAFVERAEPGWPPSLPPPDARAGKLDEVVERLLELPPALEPRTA